LHRPKILPVMRVGRVKRVVYLDGLVFKLNAREDPMFVLDVDGDE